MTTYYLVVDLNFVCTPPDHTDDAFDRFTDRVLNALSDLEDVDAGLIDPDITASITERTLSIHMGVEADSRRDALRLFAANVRTALHAAGCGTPGWPEFPGAVPTPRESDYVDA